jgi:hypothetical protein
MEEGMLEAGMATDYPAILSRKEAEALGLERYFTGKPCRNGHIAERSVRGVCLECRSEWSAKHRAVQQAAWQAASKNRRLSQRAAQLREDRINKRRAAQQRAANVKSRLAAAQQRSAQLANEAGMASAMTRGSPDAGRNLV